MAIAIGLAGEINVAGSLGVVMQPRSTARSWRQRWMELEAELKSVEAAINEPMSGTAINSAHHRLQSFFIQAYHLKDALIGDPSSGLTKPVVEDAITNDPRLSLLADLANLDKHYQLRHAPRSGTVPIIGSVSGEQSGSGGGWRLRVEVLHGTKRDGRGIAREAMDAWRDLLGKRGLI